jgi:ATP-dependent exoDNAse (exonuclease V) beta subunit
MPKTVFSSAWMLVMAGGRKTKQGIRQRYFCKRCGKYSTAAYDHLIHKTYPARAIVTALTHYNLGHTLKETSKEINRRYKLKSSPTTVHSWIKEFRDVCSFSKIREEVVKNNGNLESQIKNKDFTHRGLTYTMKLHRPKLLMKTAGFPNLRKYLFWLEENSPDEYFEDGLRSSRLKPSAATDVRTERRFNRACQMTSLALKLAKNNYERHECVEDFFLINDIATVAAEVPVWYWDKKLGGISGHIDILQVRGGKIHILDYKPDARKERGTIAQLSSYALALSFRTRTPLENIRCAYFDEDGYYEFSPKKLH